MNLSSRPGFYVILLLIAAMVLLTMWLNWKLDGVPEMKRQQQRKQESPPAAVR